MGLLDQVLPMVTPLMYEVTKKSGMPQEVAQQAVPQLLGQMLGKYPGQSKAFVPQPSTTPMNGIMPGEWDGAGFGRPNLRPDFLHGLGSI